VLSSLCLFGCRGLGVGVVVDVGDWIGMEDGAVGMWMGAEVFWCNFVRVDGFEWMGDGGVGGDMVL